MAKYCPDCGKLTVRIADGGRERDACPDGHFVQYAKASIGVGALVFRDGAVLLVERGIPPVGVWTIPGGWVEQEDNIQTAIVREIKEETNLDVVPKGIVFVRNAVGEETNSVYFVFLCEACDDRDPVPDGTESTQALFVRPDDFHTINISYFSQWLTEQYLVYLPPPLPLAPIDNYRPNAVVFGHVQGDQKTEDEPI